VGGPRPSFGPVEPTVESKAAVAESAGTALDRRDFVDEMAREHDELILAGNDGMDAAIAAAGLRVVDAKLTALKGTRLAMEEIDEGEHARFKAGGAIVLVGTEIVAVVAGGNLGFDLGDGKGIEADRGKNAREIGEDAAGNQILVLVEIVEHTGFALLEVHTGRFGARSNDFTEHEFGLALRGESNQAIQLLRGEEFVEDEHRTAAGQRAGMSAIVVGGMMAAMVTAAVFF